MLLCLFLSGVEFRAGFFVFRRGVVMGWKLALKRLWEKTKKDKLKYETLDLILRCQKI